MLTLLSLALIAVVLFVDGGNAPHHRSHPAYKVTLPTGKIVVQAHSPAIAAPKPGAPLPAEIVPLRAHAQLNVKVKRAVRLAPHKAGARVHAVARVSVSTVEQFDSVTISTIPASARYVAGYVDGNWPTYWKLRGHYPVATGIAVQSNHGADCFDMEPGNPSPSAAGPWAKWQLSQGNSRPCLYTMLSWMPAVKANLAAWGIKRWQVRLWDANWTHSSHVDVGYDCTQWTDHAFNRNLDESTCLSSFYAKAVIAKPSKPRVICFGRKAQTKKAVCGRVRSDVAKWTRASKATRIALRNERAASHAINCRKPYRRGFCIRSGRLDVKLSQRAKWFDSRVKTARKQYS